MTLMNSLLLVLPLWFGAATTTAAHSTFPASQEAEPTQGDAAQEGPKKPKLPSGLAERFQDPYHDLVPGALPKGTTPQAEALFGKLVDSTSTPGAERVVLTSFDLAFEIITRGPGAERNEAKLRVRFSEPGYVRFAVGKNKEMGFGPMGYWQRFEDGVKLLNGRDYVADRKRITEVRAVAKNFLALADPSRLRLTAIRAMPGAPGHVPPGSEKQLAKLTWLQLESPDFDLALGATGGEAMAPLAPRLFRATLGLHAETGRVLEAMVQELDKGAPLVSTSTWVSLTAPIDVAGTLLPDSVFVRYPNLKVQPWTFETKVREELYLLEGKLNPKFEPTDFEPQRL